MLLIAVMTASLLAPMVTGSVGANAAQLATSSATASATTALWPKFSTPNALLDVNVNGLSTEDLLTATTLQGVYNGEQHPTRLFLDESPTDPFWLSNGVPQGVRVVQVPAPSNGDVLTMLLQRFRPYIRGAIVDDYVPGSKTVNVNSNTVNVASSLAGVDHAIVINPSQVSEVTSLGIPVLYTFDPATFDPMTAAQTYQWALDQWTPGGLLAHTSRRMLVELNPTDWDDVRDYGVATGSFFFYLTSTDPSQDTVIHEILAQTPTTAPIMGYIPNENPDVADLSSQGHFLSPSDLLHNDSVWAAMPSPAFLRQSTEPAPIKVEPNTVYMAFIVSDGDNAQYMQNTMSQLWTTDPNFGGVPEGWTVSPGTIYFDPTMLQYFYRHLPRNSELAAGGNGIGYATQLSGADLDQYAKLSGEIMKDEDLKTVLDNAGLNSLPEYAKYIPSLFTVNPSLYQSIGTANAFGDTSGTIKDPQEQFCSLEEAREEVTSHQKPGQPVFLSPEIITWDLTPTDVLHIAQQLALAGQAEGVNYVFMTPTELALTMQRYYAGEEAGLPTSNAQSMTGAQVLAEPLVNGSYPTGTVQVTGPNIISGATDATTDWTQSSFPSGTPNGSSSLAATTYDGDPALHWTDSTTNVESWAAYPVATAQPGDTYTFSVQVAGSGQVFMDLFNGVSGDTQTVPVNLTSSYQTIKWTLTIPSTASPSSIHLQVRESGASPLSAYIANASVEQSTAAC